jgi:GNAT superfamily N-acetyltransferase
MAIIDSGVVGVAAYQTGSPSRHAARIRFLIVEPARRRLGIGGRAVLALERRLTTLAGALYVKVPASLGLALYFWLRLGYRPLTQAEAPSPASPTSPATWMVRSLNRLA